MENILIKNTEYEVQIDGYSSEGYGVCRISGTVVFVPNTLKGETWRIRIVKVSRAANYGKAIECLSESEPEKREKSLCPYFGKCGGCDTAYMSYSEELSFKLNKLNDALQRIGHQQLFCDEILASDSTTRYRNKAIFAVSELDGEARFGFYRERTHDLIPVSDCLLQRKEFLRAAAAVTAFLNKHHFKAYDEKANEGTVRHIFCRAGTHSDDFVLCIVSAEGFGSKTSQLVSELREACPELTGIALNIHRTPGNAVFSDRFFTLWGKTHITDTLCGYSYDIAIPAFFQINPPQAEKLYNRAKEYALGEDCHLLWDLYCGAGTISLCMSDISDRVIGVEIVEAAVQNAEENARKNSIQNTEFYCMDSGAAAKMFLHGGLHPECVVTDPPRKGMSLEAIDAIVSVSPKRVVYVSCNPATLARDLKLFEERGYQLCKLTAVDMFPRTCHVETVALLTCVE